MYNTMRVSLRQPKSMFYNCNGNGKSSTPIAHSPQLTQPSAHGTPST